MLAWSVRRQKGAQDRDSSGERRGERGRSPLFARAQDLREQFAAASERARLPPIVETASAEDRAQRDFEKRLKEVASMGPIVTPIVNELQLREPTANLASCAA